MKQLYLYGVIEASEDLNFGVLDLKQETPEAVECTSKDGLGVIYSQKELELGEEMPATRKNLLNHQKAIERVMENHSVLPFSFGLLVPDRKGVLEVIDSRKDFFRQKLQEIKGKIELNIKGVWNDMGKVYEHITRTYPDIGELKEKLQNQQSPDQSEKIELGKKVEYALTLEKERLSDMVLNSLSNKFEDYRMNKNITEAMFCNLAFMIDGSREVEFDEAVNAIAEELDANTTFKYVGPLPPYNFLD